MPFGPLAFTPGKLVRTNEVTVLLGDNWFAKCSAKQAQAVVDHRMKREFMNGGVWLQSGGVWLQSGGVSSGGRQCVTFQQPELYFTDVSGLRMKYVFV